MPEVIVLRVNNWEKHQPKRKDVVHPSWFKMSNLIFNDPKVQSMSALTFLVLVYIFTQCSQNNSETITILPTMLNRTLPQVGVKRATSIISELEYLRIVTVISRTVGVTQSRIEKRREEKRRIIREDSTDVNAHVTLRASAQVVPTDRGPISELSDPTCQDVLKRVTHKLQKSWLVAYPSSEWILTEIKRAKVWIAANPKKAPKDFGKFMSNWLSRGFENYRKGLPTKTLTNSQRNEQVALDLWQKVEEGKL